MNAPRTPVVVLHARQPIGVDLLATFPPDRFEVRVLTSAHPSEAFRRGTPNLAPIGSAPRSTWGERIRLIAAAAGVKPEVVTNDEYCVAACTALRAELGAAARHPANLAGYRDKIAMKAALAAAGVEVPRHRALDPVPAADDGAVEELVRELALPLVVKPREESNNRGVQVLPDRGSVRAWLIEHRGLAGWQAESYLQGRMLHANAVVHDGVIDPAIVGEYTGSLLALGDGAPVGSLTLPDDDPAAVGARQINERVIAALGADGRFVVHTELVLAESGRAVVLETAARAPGALVSEMAALAAGVQLEQANLRMQAGEPPPAPHATGRHAAWLWFPTGESVPDADRRTALRCDHRLQLLPTGTFPAASLLAWSEDAATLREDFGALLAPTVGV